MRVFVKSHNVQTTGRISAVRSRILACLISGVLLSACGSSTQEHPTPAWGLRGADDWKSQNKTSAHNTPLRTNKKYSNPRYGNVEPHTPASSNPTDPYKFIEVKNGDTLYTIARDHAISMPELQRMNRLSTTNVAVGQWLCVPDLVNSRNYR